VGRVVLESTSPGFQPGATPSQLPTHKTQRKKPDVFVTPGFERCSGSLQPSVIRAGDTRRGYSPVVWRYTLYPSVRICDSTVRKTSK